MLSVLASRPPHSISIARPSCSDDLVSMPRVCCGGVLLILQCLLHRSLPAVGLAIRLFCTRRHLHSVDFWKRSELLCFVCTGALACVVSWHRVFKVLTCKQQSVQALPYVSFIPSATIGWLLQRSASSFSSLADKAAPKQKVAREERQRKT